MRYRDLWVEGMEVDADQWTGDLNKIPLWGPGSSVSASDGLRPRMNGQLVPDKWWVVTGGAVGDVCRTWLMSPDHFSERYEEVQE